jgi:hypothetical protein
MGYAELIKTLENLPPERRAEVFDFGEFLAARCRQEEQLATGTAKLNRRGAEIRRSELARDWVIRARAIIQIARRAHGGHATLCPPYALNCPTP